MPLPQRKPNRLSGYDYSTPGAYFITVCTSQKRHLFWKEPHSTAPAPQDVPLSPLGILADQVIRDIPVHYPTMRVDHYVVMPNHIHLLLRITAPGGAAIDNVIRQFKRIVSKQAGFSVWQKDFHDHIIRRDEDYRSVWNYIDGNPARWREDDYYG